MVETKFRPGSIGNWSEELRDNSITGLAGSLRDQLSKSIFERCEILNRIDLLPRCVVHLSAEQFLDDPEGYIKQVPGELFWPVIEPKRTDLGLPKASAEVHRDGAERFIRETIANHSPDQFTVVVQPSYDVVFHGCFIIGSDGKFTGEFTAPHETPSGHGAKILFTMSRDRFTGCFRYGTENERDREIAYTAVRALPFTDEGHYKQFMRGYYEFCIARMKGGLKTIFYDYRDTKFFRGE